MEIDKVSILFDGLGSHLTTFRLDNKEMRQFELLPAMMCQHNGDQMNTTAKQKRRSKPDDDILMEPT